MSVNQILKMAFVLSVVIYSVVAIVVTGPPRWDSAWLPTDPAYKLLFGVLGFLAIGCWAAGWVIGHAEKAPRPSAEPFMPEGPADSTRQRFVLAAALIEAGAIYGLVLSLLLKDARYAFLFGAPAAMLLLLTPVAQRE